MFFEIARANINTTIGELFLANQLTVSGLQPLQALATQASGCAVVGGAMRPSKALILDR